MNKPRQPHPRLLCSAVRRWEAGFGPASGWTRLTSHHLNHCPDCADFFNADLTFEQSLRNDAVRFREQSADADLEHRILQAVSQARATPEPETRRRSVPAWSQTAFAGACVALALAFVFWPRPETTRPEAPIMAANEPATEPLDLWKKLKASGAELKLADKNPLEKEIEFVRTDSKAFVGFLALNFLPPQPEQKPRHKAN